MEDVKKVSMLNLAMHYGAILGVFWAVKYLIFVGSHYWVHFIYFYYLLNVGTFLLMYIYYFKFRDSEPGKLQSRIDCILYMGLLCLFASFFESAIIYLHFQFLEPSYYSTKIEPTLRAMVEVLSYSAEAKVAAIKLCSSRIFYIFSVFTSNLFLGLFIGSVFALIIGNRKK